MTAMWRQLAWQRRQNNRKKRRESGVKAWQTFSEAANRWKTWKIIENRQAMKKRKANEMKISAKRRSRLSGVSAWRHQRLSESEKRKISNKLASAAAASGGETLWQPAWPAVKTWLENLAAAKETATKPSAIEEKRNRRRKQWRNWRKTGWQQAKLNEENRLTYTENPVMKTSGGEGEGNIDERGEA